MLSEHQYLTELGNRDAEHVATVICRTTKDHNLKPGDRVIIRPNFIATHPEYGEHAQGVIDPFLLNIHGDLCFTVLLYPGTVQNLRHEWEHPELPQLTHENTKYRYAEYLNLTGEEFDTLMEVLRDTSQHHDILDVHEDNIDHGCRGC